MDDCHIDWLEPLRGGVPVDSGRWTCPVTGGGSYHRGDCHWDQDLDYEDGRRTRLHTWVTPAGELDEVSWETVLEPGGIEPPGMLPGWYVPAWLGGSVAAVLALFGVALMSGTRESDPE